jgi:hypothetical protein
MASEKRVRWISPDSDELVGFWPIFQILPNSSEISPESLFTHTEITVEDMLGKKKVTVEGILGKSAYIEKF